MSSTYVKRLEKAVHNNVEQIGRKAFQLSTIMEAGFPVPHGFVITSKAFEDHLIKIEKQQNYEEIRQHILNQPWQKLLQVELDEAIHTLQGLPVAVRSSAILEDLEDASFAGLYDTFLHVQGYQEIELAIRKCWASVYSKHNEHYLQQKQQKAGPIAVLIQPMVEAVTSGVVFTANPVTGNREESLVSAVNGLGDRLVSGQATPDEWVVRDKKVTAIHLPEQAIDEEQVVKVVEWAQKAEQLLEQPIDMEWAIDVDQNLHVLQVRPISTLVEEQKQTMKKEASLNIPEGFWERETTHYPDPVTAATRSTFVQAINHAFSNVSEEFALLIDTVDQQEIGGWIYQRVVPLGGKEGEAPPDSLVRDKIRSSIQFVQEDKQWQLLQEWEKNWKPEIMQQGKRLRSVNLKEVTDSQLVQHLEKANNFLLDCAQKHMLINSALQVVLAEHAFTCRELLGWEEAEVMPLLSGLSEMSSAPARSLAKLAEYVLENPELKEAVDQSLPITQLLKKDPTFSHLFDTYLEEFGCRALRCELSFPTVAEIPKVILQLLRDQLQSEYSSHRGDQLERRRREHEAKAYAILQSNTEEAVHRFERTLNRARVAYPVREEHGFYDRDLPLALLRYTYLEVGRRLVEQEQLMEQQDVFYLNIEEVVEALQNQKVFPHPHTLAELVEQRKVDRSWALDHPGPSQYGTPPELPSLEGLPEEARFLMQAQLWTMQHALANSQGNSPKKEDHIIEGLPVSSGTYRGTVRIILDESEFDRIQLGDILVCPITSPVWSMLFPSIGALVTDTGGILSHSAIIAREYRIPAVVATGNATRLLQDGQMIEVDGDTGRIKILEEMRGEEIK